MSSTSSSSSSEDGTESVCEQVHILIFTDLYTTGVAYRLAKLVAIAVSYI